MTRSVEESYNRNEQELDVVVVTESSELVDRKRERRTESNLEAAVHLEMSSSDYRKNSGSQARGSAARAAIDTSATTFPRDRSSMATIPEENGGQSQETAAVGIPPTKESDSLLAVPYKYNPDASPPVTPEVVLHEHVDDNAATSTPAWRLAILTTLPLFMGYSGMIVLQGYIKARLHIPNGANEQSYVFGVGVSFLYLGNLIFRLMHNVLFTCMKPRQRVMLAYTAMFLAHAVLAIAYYVVNSESVAWTFVAYMLSGIGIGTFESNLISCLTPLGHQTKMWAVIGIPVGFNIVSIGSFILFAIFPDDFHLQMALYFFIAVANLGGLLFYIFVVPNIEFEASYSNAKSFLKDLVRVKQWVPEIWKHCLALCIDMFCVSVFSAAVNFIFDVEEIPLWPDSSVVMPKNAFKAWYYTLSFLGDFSARRVAYYDRARNPFWFIILTAIGTGMILSKVALIAPFGMFFVMFANGSIYAQTTKHVDNCVPKKFNLAALSIWLFVGDVGSFVGAQIVQPLRGALGDVPHLREITNAPLNGTFAPTGTQKAFMYLLEGY